MNVESALVKQGAQDVDSQRPFFSVVSAVYNVARYLPDFIASLDAQTFNDPPIQIIMVDDGSTDESLLVLQDWAARNPNVTVLTQENAGQGAARNYGLTIAQGQWVNFIDPDDTVPANYFARVAAFIGEHPEVELVSTNRIFYQEKLGRLQDGHPLKWMYADGDIVVDLEDNPRYMQTSAAVAFFKRDKIRELELRFDSRVRPQFEDGLFCVHYALGCHPPVFGFMKSARYIYRKRGDLSSSMQNSLQDPRRYTDMVEFGYLAMLKTAQQQRGSVPEWLQNIMLYDLSWFFTSEDAASGAHTAAVDEIGKTFLIHMEEILTYIDEEVIESFTVRPIATIWKEIWLHGFNSDPWVSPRVIIAARNEARQEIKVITRYTGEKPEIIYYSGNKQIAPLSRKTCTHAYFGRKFLNEEIAWLPANRTIRVAINGVRAEIAKGWGGPRRLSVTPKDIATMFRRKNSLPGKTLTIVSKFKNKIENRPADHLLKHTVTFAKKKFDKRKKVRPSKQLVLATAATSYAQNKYNNAWVLMDRIHNSNDNAEDLFHYLRKYRRDVNAWFVLEEGTEDWNRLKAAGEDRLVAFGSFQWKVLMMHCVNLISSHIDVQVYQPQKIAVLRESSWNFIFLQHGVTKADMSGWFNKKRLELLVTSTPQEYESIIADGSSYVFTDREVKLTGMPRFDRLRSTAASLATEERNLILLAPTWRHWLNTPAQTGSQTQRRTVTEDFLETEFVQNWMQLVTSNKLKELAQKNNARIGFLLHPNLQSSLHLLNLPEYVEPLTYAIDFKKTLSRACMMITDYSSVFFDAAYVDCPTVYFQFDQQKVKSGGHLGKEGYFDYDRDGFGPVALTCADVLDGVEMVLDSQAKGIRVPEPYETRVQQTFPIRDGRCCERVTKEIEDLGSPESAPNYYQTGKKILSKQQRKLKRRLKLSRR